MNHFNLKQRWWPRLMCGLWLAVLISACATTPAPDPAGPRGSIEPNYPLTLAGNPERRAASLATWESLVATPGAHRPPALEPSTDTLKVLIPTAQAPLFLPKITSTPELKEAAIRESLRRFLTNYSRLFGAEPHQLSLLQRTDRADGTYVADYAQVPARFPLRGPYGTLRINFTSDWRILEINSSCIPDLEQIQRRLGNLPQRRKSSEVAERIVGGTYVLNSGAGPAQSFTVAKTDTVTVRQLVIYPRMAAQTPGTLELHLAWEAVVGDRYVVYLDAIQDEILGAELWSEADAKKTGGED